MISTPDILNAKILIVDDQEANVRLLEQMLSDARYTCIASTMNPREVSGLYRQNRYDLILLDLQMPGMDGFQVLEALKQIEPKGYLPVLVITAQPGHKLGRFRLVRKILSASHSIWSKFRHVSTTCWKYACYISNSRIIIKSWSKPWRSELQNYARAKRAFAD